MEQTAALVSRLKRVNQVVRTRKLTELELPLVCTFAINANYEIIDKNYTKASEWIRCLEELLIPSEMR